MAATRVLLVEDNLGDVRLLEEALRDVPGHGLQLSPVRTLEEALGALEKTRYDAALLDLSLPDAEGLDILKRAKAKAPGLAIIVLTGRDDADLAVLAVRDGAQDYLVKGRVGGQLLVRSVRYAIERRKSLDALERSEQQFRRLIENASDLIVVVDADWRMRFVSPSVERIIGHRADDLLRHCLTDFMHAEDIALAKKAAALAKKSERLGEALEIRLRHSGGGWRVLECQARSLFDDPVVAGLVINGHDITDRKLADQRLRDANQQLAAVIDNSPLAILQVDLEGSVRRWNKGAESMFGWKDFEAQGKLPPFLSKETSSEHRALVSRARTGRRVASMEVRRKRRDGEWIDLNLWTSVLRSDSGEVTDILMMMADITEQKRLEEQFLHAQKMEAVGRLAGCVAHDFNNLLMVITGYAQLASARMVAGDPSYAELKEVIAASERATGLTKQLLALSRRQVAQPVLFNLNDMLASMEHLLRRLVGDSVEITLQLAGMLPHVRADRSQFELVLLNLASNARDAMPNGGKLVIETCSCSGREVALRVTDSGVGMSSDTMARVFEPFFTTKEEGKGTGLGLSTSYSIVKQHGGEMRVSSKLSVGTEFEIRLPAAVAETSGD